MGFAHDTVMVEEAPSEVVTKVEHEFIQMEDETTSTIWLTFI